jgi:hypothetical protein
MANGNHWLQILCNYKSIRLLISHFEQQISNGEKKEYFFDFRFAGLLNLPIFAPAIRPCGATE